MAEAHTSDQIFIRKLTEIVQANLADENFSVKELADKSGMSLYRLNRRLHSAINKTSNQFIREIRLQKALELLQNETYTVAEVSYKTGFGSSNYFNKCFHEYFGFPPGKVIKGDSYTKNLVDLSSDIAGRKNGKISWKNQLLTLPGILISVIIIALVGSLLYKKIHKSEWSDGLASKDGKISLAVMPFRNLTNDTTWNIWQEGIQTSIISFLTNSEALKIRGSANELLQSQGLADFAALTPSLENITAKKLNASVYISGNIIKSDTAIRINAQLVNSNKGETIRSFEIEGTASGEKIFQLIDTLRHQVNDFLVVTKLKKTDPNSTTYFFDPINSPEAYGYMASARKAERRSDFTTAINMYEQALRIDSNIYDAYCLMAIAYGEMGNWEYCKKWLLRFYSKYDKLNMYNKVFADYLIALIFRTPYDAIRYVEQMIAISEKAPYNFVNLGDEYNRLFQYGKAIPEYERALEIYKKWGTAPPAGIYTQLGLAYHNTGLYKKERKLYNQAEHYFHDNPVLTFRKAVLALSEGDSVRADQYIKDYINIRKKSNWTEAHISSSIALIYNSSGNKDKAEVFYREAYTLEPENTVWMNNLGFFLIDEDRNVGEGLDIIDKALILNPDDYMLLDSKGWGLYRQGKFEEAREFLQKSWNLRMQNARYDHQAYLHLEEVKKAAARQN